LENTKELVEKFKRGYRKETENVRQQELKEKEKEFS